MPTPHPQHIPLEYKGQRMDVALAALFPDYSRTQLSAKLKSGHILINGALCKPKDKVLGEELITIQEQAFTPTHTMSALPEAIPLSMVYEDEHLLVVNKPADLVVHPGAGNPQHTLVNALLFHHPALAALPRAGIIHRLDKNTTGLLIVAKHPISYHRLSQMMRERHIHRHYLALVKGHVLYPHTLTTPFGRDPKNRLKMAVRREGKEAITHYHPLKHFQRFTLLRIQLQTGRTHQIRVHMAYIKHPIVGDPLYGITTTLPKEANEELKEALTHFERQALHAFKIEFTHPFNQARIQLEAPLPLDFHHLLQLLEQHYV